MSEARITMHTPEGREVSLPLAQALAIGEACRDFADPVWHFNECGCCVSVHARDTHWRGYIIGPDGGMDWVEVEPQ